MARPFWSKAGDPPTYPNPTEGKYSTGDGTMGSDSVLNPHNSDRGSRVPDRGPQKTAFHRGHTETNGARLSVGISAKVPHNEPQGTTASSTKLVSASKSRLGRRSSFFSGTDVP